MKKRAKGNIKDGVLRLYSHHVWTVHRCNVDLYMRVAQV